MPSSITCPRCKADVDVEDPWIMSNDGRGRTMIFESDDDGEPEPNPVHTCP